MKQPLHFTDEELIKGLISCNEEILQAYYNLYYSGIKRHVLTNHGNKEDAKDLFQEVLLVIFQKVRFESFALKCSLSTYLYSVSRFLWLKELRKRKRISDESIDLTEFIDKDMDIIEISERNERLHIYRQYFDMLGNDCRMVLSLFLEGRNIAEITSIMGYKSDQYTRNRRYRCKLSLINKIRGIYGYKDDNNGNDKNN